MIGLCIVWTFAVSGTGVFFGAFLATIWLARRIKGGIRTFFED